MKILLIRHGETAGNRERRYVGRTDEPLSEDGREKLLKQAVFWQTFLCVRAVITSPMARCTETADILFPAEKFPDAERIVVSGLRECDFGDFEYKNYAELNGDPAYQRFLDSGGLEGFPGGERIVDFKRRSVLAFEEMLEKYSGNSDDVSGDTLAFVIHGGSIMSILEALACPKRGYYDWQVKNGGGYLASACKKDGIWRIEEVCAATEI